MEEAVGTNTLADVNQDADDALANMNEDANDALGAASCSLYNSLDAESALESLRQFFDEADADGSGYLDKEELAAVVRRFYREEKVSRGKKLVAREVDEAMHRFDANGDGVLQFEEFVDMICLSESFKFRLDLDVKLQVKALVMKDLEEKRSQQLLEEREQMWTDAVRLEGVKVKHLETQVEELTEKLDDKVLQVRTLEDELQQSQALLRTCEGRLKEALAEVERLYRNKFQVPSLAIPEDDIALTPTERVRSNSNPQMNSFSPEPRTPGGRTPRSPQSARSARSHCDAFGEDMTPRTPRQGSLRRKAAPLMKDAETVA